MRLCRHLRITAASIIDPETLDHLIKNPRLHYVRSLDIDVGGRPGSIGLVAFQLWIPSLQSAVPDYFETKLPQLAAGASELLSRMPDLLTLKYAKMMRESSSGRLLILLVRYKMVRRGRASEGGRSITRPVPASAQRLMDAKAVFVWPRGVHRPQLSSGPDDGAHWASHRKPSRPGEPAQSQIIQSAARRLIRAARLDFRVACPRRGVAAARSSISLRGYTRLLRQSAAVSTSLGGPVSERGREAPLGSKSASTRGVSFLATLRCDLWDNDRLSTPSPSSVSGATTRPILARISLHPHPL